VSHHDPYADLQLTRLAAPRLALPLHQAKIRGRSLMCSASRTTVIAVTPSGSHWRDDEHVDAGAWRGPPESWRSQMRNEELRHGRNSDGAHEE
jgi:hypothetical protein